MGQEASHRHQERCGAAVEQRRLGRESRDRRGSQRKASSRPKGKAMAPPRKKRSVLCGNVGRRPGWASIQGQEQALLWGWGSVPCLPRRSLDVTPKSAHKFQPGSQQVGQTHRPAGCFPLFMLCCNYLSACIPHLSIY